MADKFDSASSVVDLLAKVEIVAEDVLATKQQVVDLDRRRQSTREALRVTLKSLHAEDEQRAQVQKSWICLGNMFMKLPTKQVKTMLDTDQKRLGEEIDSVRGTLKGKVATLRELQGQPALKGYDLNPMGSDELFAATGQRS
ncbi:p53 and DNA damage-regulated protein 1-like [Sycon ciliatum]|uniref:p53 and DNA damage-regulated protein 1-like n=1 Tax=Sycon ciliatum TaxID=27933 RepID=UPI0020AC12FE